MEHILPLELIYKILIYLPYSNVCSYCATCTQSQNLYKDSNFWINKLDYDLKITNSDGEQFIPHHYILRYSKPDPEYTGIKIYKRWITHYNLEFKIKHQYNDIIMWELYTIQGSTRDLLYIANTAVIFNNIPLLQELSQYDIYPDKRTLYHVYQSGDLPMLQWLITQGIFPTIEYANYAASKGHLHVLRWLLQYNIIPNYKTHITTNDYNYDYDHDNDHTL